jgi:hypothetical protein
MKPLVFALMLAAAGTGFPALADSWTPKVRRVGDPQGNYLNVEITADHRYMVWFEGARGDPRGGYMWHCAINQRSGGLIPPDCRGFRAFASSSWGRANPGYDAKGPYYVGMDRQGRLVMVRPTGAASGKVTVLPTPPDTRRRAIYPSDLPGRNADYVLFIQNANTPGAGMRPNNAWVELQYVDLAKPRQVHVIERQTTPRRGFAAMDAGFVRWMRNRALITYGHRSASSGKLQINGFDADQPARGPFPLISDDRNKIDPYPARLGGYEYVMAGLDASDRSEIYRRPASARADAPFTPYLRLAPPASQLSAPSLAQSHEPFLFHGRLYTVYQVNNRGRGFFHTTFHQPGELWLADLSANPVRQWRIAPAGRSRVAEPEPLVTDSCVWVFYNQPLADPAPSQQLQDGEQRGRLRDLLRQRLGERQAGQRVAARGPLPRFALYRASVPLCARN